MRLAAPAAALAALCACRRASGEVAGPLWPSCQERGTVFRHAGAYGLFTDIAALGAKEGCWLSDCTQSDKFISASPSGCAEVCARLERCAFWSYELGVRKCYLRISDAGREVHEGFMSGARGCHPGISGSDADAAGGATVESRVAMPFAQAALWAAELPALLPCNAGVGAAGCENPYAAMGVWRYAVNNLRLAVAALPAAERQRHRSTLVYINQISEDIAGFYRSPTAESFAAAVTNSLAVFSALRGWLQGAPPSEMILPARPPGAPHLPGGRSASVPADGEAAAVAGPAAARAQLADGRWMPLIGFGTWQLLGQQAYDATLAALQAGYRHIDTAQAYMNEREVGFAIRDSGVPRSELFIATKISDPSEYATLEGRFAMQIDALGVDYLDLYMLHSPADRVATEAAWRTMEALHDQGRVRSLGVSNFGPDELMELLSYARVKPVYVQNKFSVYNPGEQQAGGRSMLAFAREHGITIMGYSVINPWPFLLPPMEDPHVRMVAGRYGRSPSQVLHRWALQLGAAIIPKSATPARIAENARLLDFELSELDMHVLNGLVTLSESTIDGVSPPWANDIFGLGKVAF